MSVNKVLPGSGFGYVRAVFSGRCRGYAAPVDLLRCYLRAVGRCALRRRLAADFGGYLVTDAGPGVLPVFARGRAWHEQGPDLYCMTSERMGWGYESRGVESGPIDAPEMVSAGSMLSGDGFDGGVGCASSVIRGGLVPESLPLSLAERKPAEFSVNRWLHSFGSLAKTGVDMAAPRAWQALVTNDVVGAIDAPEEVAAGGVGVLAVLDSGRRLTRCLYSARGEA